MKKNTKKEFYDKFKLGFEIELESTPENRATILESDPVETNITLVDDGSLRSTRPDSFLGELITTKPLETEKQEAETIENMKEILAEFETTNKVKIFAYKNESCSVHMHFSFKDITDKALFLFDTKDFEVFFFQEYIKAFKSDKFLARLNNHYCANPNISGMSFKDTPAIMRKIRKLNIAQCADEKDRVDGKYRWINTYSIGQGKGIEIRIFPHIQTYKGLQFLMDWFQSVLVEYMDKPATKLKLALLKEYAEKYEEKQVKTEKLNETKGMIWYALNLEGRDKRNWSGDIRMLITKWIKQQPSLISNIEEIL